MTNNHSANHSKGKITNLTEIFHHKMPTRHTIVKDYSTVQGYVTVDILKKENNDEVFRVEKNYLESIKTAEKHGNNLLKDPIINVPPFNFSFSFSPRGEDFSNISKQSSDFSEDNTDDQVVTNSVDDEIYFQRIYKDAPMKKRPAIHNSMQKKNMHKFHAKSISGIPSIPPMQLYGQSVGLHYDALT